MKYLKKFIEISNKQRVFENNSNSTIQLIDGYEYEGTVILSPENPIEIIYKIFDVYYKGCDIIKGMEGETEWTIIASKDDSDSSHYFEMGFEKDKYGQQLNVKRFLEIKPEDYPNFEFIFTQNVNGQQQSVNIKDLEKPIRVMIPFSNFESFLNDLGNKSGLKFQSYLKDWICKKLNFNPSDWNVYAFSGGNERIPQMPNALLGKGYMTSEDIKGEIVGKL